MRRPGPAIPSAWSRALVALAGALVCASGAWGQSTAVVARAASVAGPSLLSNGSGAPFALTAGYILNPGDRVDTRGGGRVVIDLSDGSMVVVESGSVVQLKDFRAASSLRELFEITLGLVRVKINHFGGRPNPYRMNSPTASIAVRGTEFTIAVGAQGETQVVVYEGAVEVTSLTDPTRTVVLDSGRGVMVSPGQDLRTFPAPATRDIAQRADAPDRESDHRPTGPLPAGNPAPHEDDSENGSTSSKAETDARSARATASTYDRYIAGLADIAQLPFLMRYNASPEAHLDSLENPAYATQFKTGEGRIFFLPTFRGVRGLQQNAAAFGPGGTLPGDYSISPQFSIFMPVGHSGFAVGGGVSASRVGSNGQISAPDVEPAGEGPAVTNTLQTSGSSTSNFYSVSLVGARRVGRNSLGLELESLKGTGSLNSLTTDTDTPNKPDLEQSNSSSGVTQTRLTAGYSRDISKDTRIGIFYRYAFISAHDVDLSHTVNGVGIGLDSTRSAGHSAEIGARLRGRITPRLYYGAAGAWLGVNLSSNLARVNVVDSLLRDRLRRGSAALGLGYLVTPRTMLSFDLSGGAGRTNAGRSENATGHVLETGAQSDRFFSAHAAVQTDLSRRLFVSASLLNLWRSHSLNSTILPDRLGNLGSVPDSFLQPPVLAAQMGDRFSDFGAGWRFSRNCFVQYVFSTDYGVSPGTHTVMLRYTFGFGRE